MPLFKLFKKKIDADLEQQLKIAGQPSAERGKRSKIVKNLIDEKYLTSLNAHKILAYVGLGRHCATLVFFKTERAKRDFMTSELRLEFESDVINWFKENKPENEFPFECSFDYDSDENVQKNWGGSYFNRLR